MQITQKNFYKKLLGRAGEKRAVAFLKDKGFTIVGVAREQRREDMEAAIKKDGYPWLCLLELNDAGKIWEKYGVALGGGSIFMVDKEGKILAINPSAEEVKAILEKML